MPTPKKPKGRRPSKKGRQITCGIRDKLTGYDGQKQLAGILDIPVKEKVKNAVYSQASYSKFGAKETLTHMPTSSAYFLCFFRFLVTKDVPFIKFLVELESSRFPLKDSQLYNWIWNYFDFLAREVKDALHFLEEQSDLVPGYLEKVFRRLSVYHSILPSRAIKEPKRTYMTFEEQINMAYRPNLIRVCSKFNDGVLCDDCRADLSLRSAQPTPEDDVWMRSSEGSSLKEKRTFRLYDDGPRMKAHIPDRIPIFTKTIKRVMKDDILTPVEWWILRSPPTSPIEEMPSPLSDPPAERLASPPLSPYSPTEEEESEDPKLLIKQKLKVQLPENASDLHLREAVIKDVENGMTLFHRLAGWGCVDQVAELLKIGVPWNLKAYGRATALHLAARHGRLSTVELLASSDNADLSIRREDNYTPIHLASKEGHAEVVRCLLSKGANPSVRELLGMTPLHWAAMNGRVKTLEILLKACFERKRPWEDQGWINPLDRFCNTPLHYACAFNHLDAVKMLLDFGADPEILNNDGNRAQDEAMRKGHQEVAFYLHDSALSSRRSSLLVDLDAISLRTRTKEALRGTIEKKTTHYFFS